MQLVIFNQSGVTKTYLSGAISITNNTSVSVTSIAQQIALATDGALRLDILANLVYLTDGTNTFGNNDAITYLYEIIQVLNPSSDVIAVSGQNRAQSVTTSAAEATGAASRLANRKFLRITPTNGTVYWGFTSGVTTATGEPIFKNQGKTFMFTDNVPIYLISAGTVDCRISEGA